LNGNLVVHIQEMQIRRYMKVKAKIEKFNRINLQAIPCDVKTRKALKKGNSVDVDSKTAKELLSMNIVEEVKVKKSKKENK